MTRTISALVLAAIVSLATATTASAGNPRGVVYVVSQGLCYETVVTPTELPPQGPYQLITPSTVCGPGTFMTDLGPGDVGYAGGRWITLDGKMFECPLLGPGYPPPQ